MIDFGSVCSGIEAASVAVEPLGWKPAWFAEIERFPSAVLAHRYPHVPNLGDMTKIAREILQGRVHAPSLLVGGTPCQAFSVAGMRAGLEDARGQLTIKFVELADAIDHVRAARGDDECVVWWENVPGVLSDKGNAFGCFLGALVGESDALLPAGGRWTNAGAVYGPKRAAAWRVLDAQYFGLAQRRRRVFVVASARAGFDPAAVLFERDSVRRDTPPSREAGQDSAGAVAVRATERSWPAELASTLDTTFGTKQGLEDQHVNAGCQLFVPSKQPLAFSCKDHGNDCSVGISPTLRAMGGNVANGGGQVAVAFAENSRAEVRLENGDGQITGALSTGGGKAGQGVPAVCVTGEITHTLKAEGFDASEDGTGRGQPITQSSAGVRRLTPRECERLQGFPDDWTLIPWRGKPASECPDGPRYKAIGNSKAVPVVRWIAKRIDAMHRKLQHDNDNTPASASKAAG